MTDTAFIDALRTGFGRMIPHVAELGIEVQELGADGVRARLPIRPEFIGDIERNRVHTGIVTTLIDSVAGVAVFARVGKASAIATLDLRVDFLRPAPADAALQCSAECYRLTTHIAFVRAQVWQADERTPLATALATFMRGRSRAAMRGAA
jgi:uncharacterized protein (TIGR00369 family)